MKFCFLRSFIKTEDVVHTQHTSLQTHIMVTSKRTHHCSSSTGPHHCSSSTGPRHGITKRKSFNDARHRREYRALRKLCSVRETFSNGKSKGIPSHQIQNAALRSTFDPQAHKDLFDCIKERVNSMVNHAKRNGFDPGFLGHAQRIVALADVYNPGTSLVHNVGNFLGGNIPESHVLDEFRNWLRRHQ